MINPNELSKDQEFIVILGYVKLVSEDGKVVTFKSSSSAIEYYIDADEVRLVRYSDGPSSELVPYDVANRVCNELLGRSILSNEVSHRRLGILPKGL